MRAQTNGARRRNYRMAFFYVAEAVYAVIAGLAESDMYSYYLAHGITNIPEAVARAGITQVAIILFMIASIETWNAVGGGWRGVLATAPINVMVLVFSLVAFWFLRESAILYAADTHLVALDGAPLVIGGATLSRQMIDPILMASLPFFQVALNLVAPMIVRPPERESEADRQLREAEELASAIHRAKLREVGGATIHAFTQALTGRSNPLDPHGSGPPSGGGLPLPGGSRPSAPSPSSGQANGHASGHASHAVLQLTGARPTRTLDAVETFKRPAGLMDTSELVRWVKRTLDREISREEAMGLIRTCPGFMRLSRVSGQPWAAPKQIVQQRASELWASAPSERPVSERVAAAG